MMGDDLERWLHTMDPKLQLEKELADAQLYELSDRVIQIEKDLKELSEAAGYFKEALKTQLSTETVQ